MHRTNLIFVLIVFGLTNISIGSPILDINNPYYPPPPSSTSSLPALTVITAGKSAVQSFQPTIDGLLTSLDLLIASDQVLISLWENNNGVLGQRLAYELLDKENIKGRGNRFEPDLSVWTNIPINYLVEKDGQYAFTITSLGLDTKTYVESDLLEYSGSNKYSGGNAGLVNPMPGAPIEFDVFRVDFEQNVPPYDLSFHVWIDPIIIEPILGDINSDGKVDLTDFGILKVNFGLTQLGTNVPEPSTFVLMLMVVVVVLWEFQLKL